MEVAVRLVPAGRDLSRRYYTFLAVIDELLVRDFSVGDGSA